MNNDRITQEEFLKGVQKQRSLIRKLLAGEKRRTEVLTELARQRYGWMKGKFFNTGTEWIDSSLPQDAIYCIRDFTARAKNVFNDEVTLVMECTVVVAKEQHNKVNLLNCYEEQFYFKPEDDLEGLLSDKFVGWEAADERLQGMYEKIRSHYGLTYNRLDEAYGRIASLQKALKEQEESHRRQMKGMVRWTPSFEVRLKEKLCKDYEQANNMISWASRTDKPLEGEGLIRVGESADGIIGFIKKELGV